jgi:hypothetical protein
MASSDTGYVLINSQTLGTGTVSLPFMDNVEIDSPVGPGVTVSVPTNTGDALILRDPLHFQGTIDFRAGSAGANHANGVSSLVGLAGVTADHWTWANNVLTLFKGNQVTDTLKVIPDPTGWAVYAGPGGVELSSPGLSASVVSSLSWVQLGTAAQSASV